MPVQPTDFYKPKVADGDLAGMIKTKSTGDLFTSRLAGTRGCCQGPTGWSEYSARLKIPVGILTSDVMEAIAKIAREFGRGEVYLTARLGMEIPGVPEERLLDLQEELAKVGVQLAACGPRMRSVVACKGTVCVHGNIDTFRIAWEIDQQYNDGTILPHKFKVGVAGCASTCSKPRLNDVGLIGVQEPYLDIGLCNLCGKCTEECRRRVIQIENGMIVLDKEHCVDCGDCARACQPSAIIPFQTGIDLYAGGRWDRIKQTGIRIARFLTETDAIKAVGQIKEWFQKNGKQGERLGAVILRKDLLEFQDEVLQGINRDDWSEITPEAEESFRIAI